MPFDIAPLLARLTTQAIYPAFGGVVVQCVYHHAIPGSGSYNPETGNYDPDTVVDVDVGVIVTRYAAEEISEVVLSTDIMGLIQQSELDFTPVDTDSLTYLGAEWQIKEVQSDAARLAWQLRLRREGTG